MLPVQELARVGVATYRHGQADVGHAVLECAAAIVNAKAPEAASR